MIRGAWGSDDFTWNGTHYRYARPIKLLPPPVQKPHPPIWCTANFDEEHFRWIGRQGFNLMTLPWLSPSNARTKELISIWRESLVAAGHDPATREHPGDVLRMFAKRPPRRMTRPNSGCVRSAARPAGAAASMCAASPSSG